MKTIWMSKIQPTVFVMFIIFCLASAFDLGSTELGSRLAGNTAVAADSTTATGTTSAIDPQCVTLAITAANDACSATGTATGPCKQLSYLQNQGICPAPRSADGNLACNTATEVFNTASKRVGSQKDVIAKYAQCDSADTTVTDDYLNSDDPKKACADLAKEDTLAVCRPLNGGTGDDPSADKKEANKTVKDSKRQIDKINADLTQAQLDYQKDQAKIQKQIADDQVNLQRTLQSIPLKMAQAFAKLDQQTQQMIEDEQQKILKIKADQLKLQDQYMRSRNAVAAAKVAFEVTCRKQATAKVEALQKAYEDKLAAIDAGVAAQKLAVNTDQHSLFASKTAAAQQKLQLINQSYSAFYSSCKAGTDGAGGVTALASIDAAQRTADADFVTLKSQNDLLQQEIKNEQSKIANATGATAQQKAMITAETNQEITNMETDYARGQQQHQTDMNSALAAYQTKSQSLSAALQTETTTMANAERDSATASAKKFCGTKYDGTLASESAQKATRTKVDDANAFVAACNQFQSACKAPKVTETDSGTPGAPKSNKPKQFKCTDSDKSLWCIAQAKCPTSDDLVSASDSQPSKDSQ
jgi:hypothetical protein